MNTNHTPTKQLTWQQTAAHKACEERVAALESVLRQIEAQSNVGKHRTLQLIGCWARAALAKEQA